MRGRKPVPTHLKIVNGNPGRRPLSEHEPMPATDIGEAPGWLSDEQKAGWDYALANAPLGLLKMLDAGVLTVWVVAESIHREAAIRISLEGLTTEAPNSGLTMQSPFVGILNRQAQIMQKAASEIGFSPSSRSRITIDKKTDAKSAAQKYFTR